MASDYGSKQANDLLGGTVASVPVSASKPDMKAPQAFSPSSFSDYGSPEANKLLGGLSVSKVTPVDTSSMFPKTKGTLLKNDPSVKKDIQDTISKQEAYLTDLEKQISDSKAKVDTKNPDSVSKYNVMVDNYNKVHDSYIKNNGDLAGEENEARLTKNPIIAKITGGTNLKSFISDTLGGLPEASTEVSKFINRPFSKISDKLSNTNFMKQSAEGVNAGYGNAAVQTLQKLSDLSGLQVVQGATAGLYQAPDTGQKNDFVDTVFQGLSQGLGMIMGLKSIGAILPTATATAQITRLVSNFPLIAKYIVPYIADAVEIGAGMAVQTQLNPNLANNLGERAKTLLTTVAEAPIYAILGGIKNAKISVPASFGLGAGMAKLSGADNKDAIASGFTFAIMDGVARTQGKRGLTEEEMHEKLKDESFKILNKYSPDIKLTENSTPEQIKAIYNAAVHQTHPDLGGSKTNFEAIQNAYDLLSKGAVSKSPDHITEEEKSVQDIHEEIKGTIEKHGVDVAHQGIQESLGVDNQTADRMIRATETKEARNNPEKVAKENIDALVENEKKIADSKSEANSLEGKSMDEISEYADRYVNENKEDLKNKYIELHGNNFNVDKYKDLIPGHVENSTMSEAFHTAAAKEVGKMIDEALGENGEGKSVLFTAGATGVGKSTGVSSETGSDIIVDGTLASDRALEQIEKALKNGYRVKINYTESTPEKIYDNLVARAKAGGRTVPIETAYNTLLKSRQHALRAEAKFSSNPNFTLNVIDQTGSSTRVIENGIDFLKSRSYNKEDIAQFKKEAYSKIDEDKNIGTKQKEGFNRRKDVGSGGRAQNVEHAGEESGRSIEDKEVSEVRKESEGTSRMKTFEGTGDTKTRGLSRGVAESTIAKKLTDTFGDLPEFKQVNVEEQETRAKELIATDYEMAKRVALGHEESPEGLIPEAVFIAVQDKAFADGDLQTLNDLATASSLSSEATTMGQRLRILAERDPESPVTAQLEVIKEKEKVFEKKNKKSAKSEKRNKINELKDVKKKSAPKLKEWSSFIESITC